MLLAFRGSVPALASDQLLQGVRWALFAEKAVVMLHEAEMAAATPVDVSMPANVQREALKVRTAGTEDVKRLRPLLFPEDDDG